MQCSKCGATYLNVVACPSCFPPTPSMVKPLPQTPIPLRFSHEQWEKLVASTMDQIKKLASLKGGEYSGDVDRLANFRRNGQSLGLPMETIWAVYAGKHWDAIQQYIKDQREGKERTRLEPIGGRVDDLLVYLILLKAMLEERGEA
jgi:hypothetical protein